MLCDELIALKERIEDILDTVSPAAAKPAAKAATRSASRGPERPRLAIVVGHSAKDGGAAGLAPVGPSEYPWNSDLAALIKTAGVPAGIEVEIFLRDGIGISGAYKQVSKWGATAAIELHYNADSGTARGSETLWGPACSRSEAWATAIQAAMVKLYDRRDKLDRGLRKTPPHNRGSSSVNALSSIPSCLIEPFFGDNPDDAALGGAKKKALAQTLVDTFVSRFSPAPGTRGGLARGPEAAPYTPPASATKFIGNIDLKPATSFSPGEQMKGFTELRVLRGGIIFMDTDLSTDADGSPRAKQIDPYGQLETAFNFTNQSGQARYVNAEKIPYIVMPGSRTPHTRPKEQFLYNRLGLKLGDLAAVIWKDKIEFAMFADAGPNDHIGEGSIALVEKLGFDPWNGAKTKITKGIPGPGVLTFVFPGSKLKGLTPQNAAAEIRRAGAELFKSIGGLIA